MIRTIFFERLKQYLPLFINSICTALCVVLAGCKLTANSLSLEIEYPVNYSNQTNSISY